MSTALDSRETCKGCGTELDRYHQPGFCSPECVHRNRGQKILNQIQSDHTLCGSCFKILKTIERPPQQYLNWMEPEVSQALIGYEHGTEHVTDGVDEEEIDEYRRIEYTRPSCVCGNVDPNERIELLDDLATGDRRSRLYQALKRLADKGAIDDQPDWNRLQEAYDPDDLAYTVGFALSDSRDPTPIYWTDRAGQGCRQPRIFKRSES